MIHSFQSEGRPGALLVSLPISCQDKFTPPLPPVTPDGEHINHRPNFNYFGFELMRQHLSSDMSAVEPDAWRDSSSQSSSDFAPFACDYVAENSVRLNFLIGSLTGFPASSDKIGTPKTLLEVKIAWYLTAQEFPSAFSSHIQSSLEKCFYLKGEGLVKNITHFLAASALCLLMI